MYRQARRTAISMGDLPLWIGNDVGIASGNLGGNRVAHSCATISTLPEWPVVCLTA
jgi:hypothetical protein